MVELIGDKCQPSELVAPEDRSSAKSLDFSGALIFSSGALLWCVIDGTTNLITFT